MSSRKYGNALIGTFNLRDVSFVMKLAVVDDLRKKISLGCCVRIGPHLREGRKRHGHFLTSLLLTAAIVHLLYVRGRALRGRSRSVVICSGSKVMLRIVILLVLTFRSLCRRRVFGAFLRPRFNYIRCLKAVCSKVTLQLGVVSSLDGSNNAYDKSIIKGILK